MKRVLLAAVVCLMAFRPAFSAPSPAYQTVVEPFFINPTWWTLDKSNGGETIRRAYDTSTSQGSRFAWGGYDAGTSNAVAIDNQTFTSRRSQLNFNAAADVAGSFAYTRFDTASTDFNAGASNPCAVVNASSADARIELDVTCAIGEQVAVLVRDDSTWWRSSVQTMPTVTADTSSQTVIYHFFGASDVSWNRVDSSVGGGADLNQVDNNGEGLLTLSAAGTPNFGALEGMGVLVANGPGNASLTIGEMRLIGPESSPAPPPSLDEKVLMRLCTPAWRGIGSQQAQNVAKKFTMVFGNLDPTPFHQGNPDCKCCKYYLGPYVGNSLKGTLPREALASDASGNFIETTGFANWLVVPDNQKWLDYHVQNVKDFLAQNPQWDGIFEDSMGTAPVDGGYVTAPPVNPHTGKLYTDSEWVAAESVMMDAVRKALPPGKRLMMNGLSNDSKYWTSPESTSSRFLLQYVDGGMAELTWRAPTDPLTTWPSQTHWNQTVSMIQDVQARGVMGYWWTKMWTDGDTSNNEPNADVLIPQWRRFTLASVLLAAGTKTYYNFDTKKSDNNAAEPFPEYDAPLGYAFDDMKPLNVANVYGRPFTGGLVLVNPTGSTVTNVTIPWTTWKGKTLVAAGEEANYSEPFTIPAHTGLILTGSTAAMGWEKYAEIRP